MEFVRYQVVLKTILIFMLSCYVLAGKVSATSYGSGTYSANKYGGINIASCAPDINQDGRVDLFDYSSLLIDFLKLQLRNPRSDINKDGIVDLKDYSILVNSFLKACNG